MRGLKSRFLQGARAHSGVMYARYGLGLALLLTSAGDAQIRSPGAPQSNPGELLRMGPYAIIQYGPTYAGDNERRFDQLNADRRKSMVADVNKLLKLADELNAEVAETPSGGLTPTQLRKVAQIEKLARSVKERMKVSMGVGPGFQETYSPNSR